MEIAEKLPEKLEAYMEAVHGVSYPWRHVGASLYGGRRRTAVGGGPAVGGGRARSSDRSAAELGPVRDVNAPGCGDARQSGSGARPPSLAIGKKSARRPNNQSYMGVQNFSAKFWVGHGPPGPPAGYASGWHYLDLSLCTIMF